MLPSRMSRLLMTGPKTRMTEAIEAMHRLGVVHIDDFSDPTKSTARGDPLAHGDQDSASLVRIRALQSRLDLEPTPIKQLATTKPEEWLREAEQGLLPLVERVHVLEDDLARVAQERSTLEFYQSLSFDLGAARTLKSVQVRTGRTAQDPTSLLASSGINAEVLRDDRSGATVILSKGDVDRQLSQAGFVAIPLPAGYKGTPVEAIKDNQGRVAQIQAKLNQANQDLVDAKKQWGVKINSLEAYFAGEVEKSQVPLSFAVTRSMFLVEGWVPNHKKQAALAALEDEFKGALVVADLGDTPRHVADAHHGENGHHDHEDHAHHEDRPEEEAPVQLRNGRLANPFEFILGLLGRPRYQEIDPTKLMLIFFPLFFGLMVGDVIVGLAIIAFGLFLKKNYLFGIGGPSVGKALMYGGIWSVIIGAFVFGEALGMHFILDDKYVEQGENSWESVLGFSFSCDPNDLIYKTYCPSEATNGTYALHAGGEEVGGNPLAGSQKAHLSLAGFVNLGYFSKIHDVQALLLWSCIIGLTHLVLGLVLGVRNIYVSHGLKLAIQEKVSWLIIIASIAVVALGYVGLLSSTFLYAGIAALLVGIALLWAGVQHTLGAGFISVLEIPSFFGNVLSYTRLAAIGASKAGMALAFGTIAFQMIGGAGGWVVYGLSFVGITLLAILASSLQSLRLQFVEFFSKFYTGGGRAYVPFGGRSK